jgi:hypothetical protein
MDLATPSLHAVGRIAAWRVVHGYLQDTESEILASFAGSDEPFQPEDRGLTVIGIKAGMLIVHYFFPSYNLVQC